MPLNQDLRAVLVGLGSVGDVENILLWVLGKRTCSGLNPDTGSDVLDEEPEPDHKEPLMAIPESKGGPSTLSTPRERALTVRDVL